MFQYEVQYGTSVRCSPESDIMLLYLWISNITVFSFVLQRLIVFLERFLGHRSGRLIDTPTLWEDVKWRNSEREKTSSLVWNCFQLASADHDGGGVKLRLETTATSHLIVNLPRPPGFECTENATLRTPTRLFLRWRWFSFSVRSVHKFKSMERGDVILQLLLY